jgi:tetratricopeptide (TPR) repeat protein
VRDLHLRYYARLAEEIEPNLYVPGSREWLDRISIETANIRAALDWAFSSEGGDRETGARLFAALCWAWYATGRHAEGRHWADPALMATKDRPSLLRGRVLAAASLFAAGESDFDAVADLGIETLTLGDDLSLPYLQAYGRDMLGIVRWVRGDFDEAVALHRQSVDLFDECGDHFNAALACAEYGRDLAAAGRQAEARAVFDAGVARARELNEETALGFALDGSAVFALGSGDLSAAATLIDEAVGHYRASGYQEGVASGLNTRGQLAVASGDLDAAEADFIEAIELCRRLGHAGGAAAALDGLAYVAEHQRGPADAVECCAAAAGLRARAGVSTTPQEQASIDLLIGRLRAGLGDDAFDAAWAAGTRRRLDDLQALIAANAPAPVAG